MGVSIPDLPVTVHPAWNAWYAAVHDLLAANDGSDTGLSAALAAETAARQALAASVAATYLPLPGGTKSTGKTPVVQSDGTVQWATPAAGSSAAVTRAGNGAATVVFS